MDLEEEIQHSREKQPYWLIETKAIFAKRTIGLVHQYGRRLELVISLPLSNLHALASGMEQNKNSHEDLDHNHKYLMYVMRKKKVIEIGFACLPSYTYVYLITN